MSRIHDALRKAERERASASGAEQSAVLSATLGSESPPPSLPPMPSVETLPPPAAAERFGPSDSMRIEEQLRSLSAAPRWNPDKKTMLFFEEQHDAEGTEQFRSLRSHLYMIRKELPLKKVLVTSPLPREGKTFVAANLAQAFVRQQDRRVLVIDADLRRSDMHTWFGASSTPGLTDYLAGKAETFQVVQRGPLDNFFFIPGGNTVTNPLELIGNGRLKDLLDRLAPIFDWIIMDSPPATLVSDSKMLADMCDGVLMVVMAASTPYDIAQKGCQEFRGKRILGVVLNRAQGSAAYTSLKYYDAAAHRDELEKSGKP